MSLYEDMQACVIINMSGSGERWLADIWVVSDVSLYKHDSRCDLLSDGYHGSLFVSIASGVARSLVLAGHLLYASPLA